MKTPALLFGTLFTAICVLLPAGQARAHCDALDGPVVQAALRALASSNANLVLVWVQKEHEAEVKKAFARTLAVRKLGADAKELADLYFFETVVRIHRAGEGAPYTGLKPAGQNLDPSIPVADAALRDGKLQPLLGFLSQHVDRGVREHFEAAMKRRDFDQNDVEAGRRFVKAYVEYIHCVQALYQQASAPIHGHFHAAEDQVSHKPEHSH